MEDGSPISFGARVKQLREQRGWSQRELARRAKLNQAMIVRIENEEAQQVAMRTVVELADVFRLSIDVLIGRQIPEGREERVLLPM